MRSLFSPWIRDGHIIVNDHFGTTSFKHLKHYLFVFIFDRYDLGHPFPSLITLFSLNANICKICLEYITKNLCYIARSFPICS